MATNWIIFGFAVLALWGGAFVHGAATARLADESRPAIEACAAPVVPVF